MSLRSLFARPATPPDGVGSGPSTADDDTAIAAARTAARRRLIGAVVLLALAVVVFPLVFESKPRPMNSDVRVELRRAEGTVAVAPLPAAPRPSSVPPPEPAPVEAAPATPSAAASASPVVPSASPASTPKAAAPPRPAAAAASVAAKPAPVVKLAPASASAPARSAASAPVQAESAAGGRYVVQVGAFTDPVAVRETRQRVEKLGLKTYTQVIENDSGRRTRVRVGPFETRAEAEAAGLKIKGAGLPAYLLTL